MRKIFQNKSSRLHSLALLAAASVVLSSCSGSSTSGNTRGGGSSSEEPASTLESTENASDKGADLEDRIRQNTKDSGNQKPDDVTESQDTEEAVQDGQVNYADLYQSYLTTLNEKEENIQAIDWQTRSYMSEEGLDTFSGYGYYDQRIAFYDLTADDVPEMIVLSGVIDTDAGYCYIADLDIYGFCQGEVKNLYHQDAFEAEVAGGTRMAVFAIDGGMVIYESMGDEAWDQSFTRYVWNGDSFGRDEYVNFHTQPNDDYTGMIEAYTKNDAECDAAAFVETVQNYSSQIRALLLEDMIDDETVYSMREMVPDKSVNYQKAVAYLNARLQAVSGTPVGMELFESFAGDYDFSSGAGGWGTYLTLHEDGTFEGSYHDSDMGDMGDEYPNGTVYVSNFTGRFKNPVQETNGVYMVELDHLSYDGLGNVEIVDGVRYIYTEPYGVSGSDVFEFYPAGTPMNNLPQDYVDWIRMPRAWGDADVPETLPFNGIYNIMQQEGFGQ